MLVWSFVLLCCFVLNTVNSNAFHFRGFARRPITTSFLFHVSLSDSFFFEIAVRDFLMPVRTVNI